MKETPLAQSSFLISPAALNIPITLISGVVGQACVQPIIMVKVRMQLHSQNINIKPIKSVLRQIYTKQGGIFAFYRGLDAGCLRQGVFTPVRMGVYYWMSELIKARDPSRINLSLKQKMICSGLTGLVGAIACSPFDLAQIRLQADRTLPSELRRNYRNAIDAVMTTAKEEGIRGLFKGTTPNIVRCSIVNVVNLASYEEIKQRLRLKNPKLRVIVASLLSSSLTAFCSLPFDNLKVKLQKQKKLADGSMPYRGMSDCLVKSVRREGVRGLWSGLSLYMCSVASLCFLILVITESLRRKAGLID